MKRDLSRRSLLASGGMLFAGGVLSGVTGATRGDDDATVQEAPPFRWAETYDGGQTDAVQNCVRTSDGNYVVVGQTGDSAQSGRPWAFSIDETGGRRWQQVFDTDDAGGFSAVVETGDGDVLLGGALTDGEGNQRPVLARMTVEGEVEWRRTVDFPREGATVVTLVPAGDDQYVVGALATGGEGLDVSTWIFAVDGEGERQWSETISPRHTSYGFRLAENGDGGYVVSGAVRDEPTEDNQQPPFVAWLFTVDGEGNQQWSQTFREATDGSDHQLNLLYDVTPTDSGYLAVGDTAPQLFGGRQGWVLAVDGEGERQQQTRTSPPEMDVAQIRAVEEFGDGYAAIGTALPNATGSGNAWILGTGADASERWTTTRQYAAGTQTLAATGTGDDGLLTVGNVTVEGDQTASDAIAFQVGGDPVETGTATAESTPTSTATATPSPTPTETPEPTPTPTPSPTPEPTAMATDEPTATDEPDGTTSGGGPGFGVGSAVAALGAGALLRRSDLSVADDADE